MAANIIDINTYQPSSTDCFFFDNNVWIFIFGALGGYNHIQQKIYSKFLKDIQSARATIFTNSMILSEFSNRLLRFSFAQWKQLPENCNADYKRDFIGTTPYLDMVEELEMYMRRILKVSEKTNDNFNAVEMNNVLKHLAFIDFNDSYLIEMAALDTIKIVTDDKDFVKYQDHNIDVVTIVK